MAHYRALLATSVLLTGCFSNVVALQPKAQSVKLVHETDRPLHCDVKGKISGTSRSADAKEGRAGAENDFRNHAAELRGNFAFVDAERNGPVGTSSQKDYFLGGQALFCQTEEMEEADEKAAAAARDQKEKNRLRPSKRRPTKKSSKRRTEKGQEIAIAPRSPKFDIREAGSAQLAFA